MIIHDNLRKMRAVYKCCTIILKWMFVSIILVIILRVFFFESLKIPSHSMDPTLKEGDYIIVNKLVYGARIFQNWNLEDSIKILRLKGFGNIKRNDVVVFNFPYINTFFSDSEKRIMNLNSCYVKRCVALPGDIFYIENGIYKVYKCDDTLGIRQHQQALLKTELKDYVPNKFKKLKWTLANWGPYYIPKRNDIILIDTQTIALYKDIIEYESKKEIRISGDSVFNGKQLITFYKFIYDYYFVVGDYVFDSYDSRYWGLLPKDHIIGKAHFIWKSYNRKTDKLVFERFFKIIN